MAKPEKHVFICTQHRPADHPRPACQQKNASEIADEFYWYAQEHQLFEKIRITTTGCLGPCSEGPSVLVYPEGVMYAGVKKNDVATIFEQHLINNQPVKELLISEEFWG